MVKAHRIQEKAAGVGFDWDERLQVLVKVKEEIQELEDEIRSGNQDRVEAEFGDVLFSLVNYARYIKVNPETALERTNKKFIQRFKIMENLISNAGKQMVDMSLTEMDKYWDIAISKE